MIAYEKIKTAGMLLQDSKLCLLLKHAGNFYSIIGKFTQASQLILGLPTGVSAANA